VLPAWRRDDLIAIEADEVDIMADRGFRVVVVGAGVAGLYMAEVLKRARIDFTVYEKAGEVGGTWRDNRFPGLFVDVLSRQYEFPFQPNYGWSRKYAPAEEIWSYIKKVARDRGLTKFIRFNEEIVGARFTNGRWHIEAAKGRTDVADVFVCATGFLHKPVLPDIPGRESFAGPSFHSARWNDSVPYEGKRWGVIGSGASGVQITEALAWAGGNVTQFIRRAQWVHIRENPYAPWWERLKLRLPGAYHREQRRLWQFINEFDSWRLKPGPQREAMEREFRSYLDIVRDPELKQKLTPDYNLGCTRIPKSDRNYYEAVQLPNVRIVKGHIERIVPEGLVMADGTREELDVLVYATGFDPHAYMRPMQVTGLNGVTIEQAWQEKIYSYGGVALPGFPNLFMLYGPFAPVNNVPVPLGLSQEIGFIMRLVDEAQTRNAAVAPTAAATERFLAQLGDAFPGTVWVGGCQNWYTSDQPNPVLWPLPQSEHEAFFADLPIEDFQFTPTDQERTAA
jgi:cation diffusion facilitator CzcD-associated flavoprotein CzcO